MTLQQRIHRLPPRVAGFAAIELILVTSLLAFAAVGVPVILSELRGARVFAASNELASWLEAVRRAAERGIACDVVISDTLTATNTTDVATATPQADTLPNNCLQNSPFRIDSGRSVDKYSISSTINAFTFTPRGSVFVDGGGEVIQVQIQAVEAGEAVGTGHCVRVEPPLGFIETGPC